MINTVTVSGSSIHPHISEPELGRGARAFASSQSSTKVCGAPANQERAPLRDQRLVHSRSAVCS